MRRGAAAPAGDNQDRVMVFDFDGTLADTFEAGFHILNDMARDFGYRPLDPAELDRARDMNARQLMSHLGIPMSRMPSIAKRGVRELHKVIDKIESFHNIPEVLRELHRRGIKLGILTSNAEDNVRAFLKRHEIELFTFVRCSSRLFGKAREIRSVMRQFHWQPDQLLFVGDETRDIEAAKKAGIAMAAVTWGYNSLQALEALRPEFVIHHPRELPALVGIETRQ